MTNANMVYNTADQEKDDETVSSETETEDEYEITLADLKARMIERQKVEGCESKGSYV